MELPRLHYWLVGLLASVLAGAASAGEGVVALQTAAPACANNSSGRYVDCDNGTVTDNATGLVWLANADCFGTLDWFEAMAAVAGLADLSDDGDACDGLTPDECDCGLSDGSSTGEWRLPSIEEWEAMRADDMLGCSPTIPSDSGDQCWSLLCASLGDCSFYYVQSQWYWSSSSYVPVPEAAWGVNLLSGDVTTPGKHSGSRVWPVRGGQ